MKEIKFPGLGLEFNIKDIAFSIFGINIYWYAIIIVLAFVIGIIFCKKDDGKYGIKFDNVLELLLVLIPISIISARLYYVLFSLEYYLKNPLEIIDIKNGGLAIYGGIIGAVITIIIYCRIKKINFLDMFDYIVPYLALGQSIGRWGNFLNCEAYGTKTNSIFRMGIIENGNYIEVHPTFLYESICTFVIFIILFCMKNKRKYKGQLTYIYLALYGVIRAIIEGLRTDSLMLFNFRVSQILSVLLLLVFFVILIYKKIKERVKNV